MELYDETRDCFWTKYTFDLTRYGYRTKKRDFRKYFAELMYSSWKNIISSYNRLFTSIINGVEPSIPYDLVYDYAKEKKEQREETKRQSTLIQMTSQELSLRQGELLDKQKQLLARANR